MDSVDVEFLEKAIRRYWVRVMLYSDIVRTELHKKIIRVLDSYVQRQKRGGVERAG